MSVTTTSYGHSFTVTRAELDEARRTAWPMMGVAALARMRRGWEIEDQAEAEFLRATEAHNAAVAAYPRKLAEWQTYRKREIERIERNITEGFPYTYEHLKWHIDHIWSSMPVDPDKELAEKLFCKAGAPKVPLVKERKETPLRFFFDPRNF